MKAFDDFVHDVQDAQRVFKTRVGGARVDIVTPSELFYPTQSLKVGAVDDAVFGTGQIGEPVNAVVDRFTKNLGHSYDLSS